MARYVKVRDIDSQGKSTTAWVPDSEVSSGSLSLETPTGVVDGVNDTFTFTSPPIMVFRNGKMETGLGTVVGNTFIFDEPPVVGGVVEGYI